jgi:hypothetical protein
MAGEHAARPGSTKQHAGMRGSDPKFPAWPLWGMKSMGGTAAALTQGLVKREGEVFQLREAGDGGGRAALCRRSAGAALPYPASTGGRRFLVETCGNLRQGSLVPEWALLKGTRHHVSHTSIRVGPAAMTPQRPAVGCRALLGQLLARLRAAGARSEDRS